MADCKEKIQVLVVDDHPVVAEGLIRILSGEDIEVIGTCGDGLSAMRSVEELHPDIVLMDIRMPGISGIDTAERIKANYPNVGVMLLTLYSEYVIDAIKAGADAYVLKDVSRDELLEAVRHVARSPGGIVIATGGKSRRQKLSTLPIPREHEIALRTLSQREMTILDAITHGLTNREIASKLNLSEQTVKNHVTSILRKLGVSTRLDAAAVHLSSKPTRFATS